MAKINRDYILYTVLPIAIPIVIGTLYVSIHTANRNELLRENGEYIEAVIYKFDSYGKGGRHKMICYKYIVGDTEYESWGKWYPRSDTLFWGDTIVIIYNKENPAHSKTKRDFESPLWRQ
ncbi:MAG: hypothetical protein FWC23_04820 [Chitinispirillia bacterium]|nr:hypothetical protein [Chitinispirillia bacterium]MCL2268489.1 hypothetical protein [Chitinispirillia bacterium]